MRNWRHEAGKIWSFLTRGAKKKKTFFYKDIAPRIKTNPLSVRYALGPIQSYCLNNNLPPLTSLVVSAGTGLPGTGFIGWSRHDLQTAHDMVYAFNWEDVENPYGAFGPTDTLDSLAEQLAGSPASAGDIYRKVKDRGEQQRIFRQALLEFYEERCAVCGLTFIEALDAAHIKSWQQSQPDERLDPRNGLLLCATHHRLFDNGLLTLNDSFEVVYCDPSMEGGEYSEQDKDWVVNLHGHSAFFPDDENYRPSLKFLRAHHKEHDFDEME